jgi:hypothetical protein
VDADLLIDDVNVGKISAEWPVILGIGMHRTGECGGLFLMEDGKGR